MEPFLKYLKNKREFLYALATKLQRVVPQSLESKMSLKGLKSLMFKAENVAKLEPAGAGALMRMRSELSNPAKEPTKGSGVRGIGPWSINTVHNVDCLTALSQTPSDVFDIAITSPPYWGQREGSGLGTEADPRDYVANLVSVLAEVMRCLKPTGTFWLNLGDSYNTPINWREQDYNYSSLGKEGTGLPPSNSAYSKKRGRRRAYVRPEVGWLQYGNLLAIPYRVVTALCDLGFLFRGEVVWEKSRPLPEGICRRPHRKHEGIYVFAKDERHIFRTKPPVGSIWKLVQTPNLTPHSSTFPIDLPLQCIKSSGMEGRGVVLDPFMGSGTTGKAARMLGLDFIGFEIDLKTSLLAREYIESETQEWLPLD
jgi:DNA modification methylase